MAIAAIDKLEPDACTTQRMQRRVRGPLEVLPLEVLPLVDSTQAELMRRGAAQPDRAVLIADAQSAGRGRMGRVWISTPGNNLFLSMYLRAPQGERFAPALALALGVAACQTLHEAGFTQVRLKWPNDLLIEGRKLGGILVESAGALEGVVAGIGLNLHLEPAQIAVIGQPIAVLSQFGEPPCRDVLAAALIANWNAAVHKFTGEGFMPFQSRWHSFDAFAGKEVRAICGGEVIDGIAAGVDRQGRLLLHADGVLHAFSSAETSLRPGVAPATVRV